MAAIDNLSEKHKRFVKIYAQSLNKVKSYMQVYPDSTYEAAATSAWELLKNPEIKAALDEEFNASVMTKSEVLQRINAIADINVSELMNDFGEIDIVKVKERNAGYLIKSISDTKFGKRINLYDSQKALDSLAKIHRLYEDKNEVTVNIVQEISAKERLEQTLDKLADKLGYN